MKYSSLYITFINIRLLVVSSLPVTIVLVLVNSSNNSGNTQCANSKYHVSDTNLTTGSHLDNAVDSKAQCSNRTLNGENHRVDLIKTLTAENRSRQRSSEVCTATDAHSNHEQRDVNQRSDGCAGDKVQKQCAQNTTDRSQS